MKYLRTVSTSRLLAMIAGLLIAIAAGTAIAVAASAGGPLPPPSSLAGALHDALHANAPTGISADITFTNSLISSADIQGSDPILTGATGRLWATQGHFRLELQSDNGDAQLVVNNGSFWAYDPASNTVYEGTLPQQATTARDHAGAAVDKPAAIPSIATIQSDLTKLAKHAIVSGAIPSDFGGAAAYTVKIKPKHDGSLLGAVQLAFDAAHGIPLDFAIYASGNNTPVLELKATGISYGAVPLSDFQVKPPAGAKIVKVSLPSGQGKAGDRQITRLHELAHGKAKLAKSITGVAAVASHLKFKLSAPSQLDGLPRRSVELLQMGGKSAALVLYGEGLGGVAVIEHAASSGGPSLPGASSGGGDRRGLALPTVSINGTTGQELDTAIGTIVTFTRGGVSYVVVGSVPAVAADAAARAL